MVRARLPAAKAADPGATIWRARWPTPTSPSRARCSTAASAATSTPGPVHPYSGDRSPLDPGPDQWIQNSFVRGVPKVRETLLAAGEDKPIWLTEFGWSTCTYREAPPTPTASRRQADYLVEAFTKVAPGATCRSASGSTSSTPTPDAPGDRLENYGLLRVDGSEKPAYGAFARMSSEVAGGPLPEQPANAATTQGQRERHDRAQRLQGRVSVKVVRRKLAARARQGPAPVDRDDPGASLHRVEEALRGPRLVHGGVRVDRKGRYQRTLRKSRLRKGRWRIGVGARDGVRQARLPAQPLRLSASR